TMAPEQLRGGPVGPTADVYGLGVLLYRLVSARYPVEAETLAELSERHRAGALVPLRDRRPDLPADFVRAVAGAPGPAPERRFASAGEMERALAAVAGAAERPQDEAPPRARAMGWRTVMVAALIAAGAILLVRAAPWGPHGTVGRSPAAGPSRA